MPPAKMLVNGIDLSAYGLWVECPQGWGDAPRRTDQPTTVLGGELINPLAARLAGRDVSIPAVLLTTSATAARDQWDQAKLVLASPWLEVMILPWTDRQLICRYDDMAWQPHRIEDFGFRLTLRLHSPSPYLVAPLVDSYGLTAGQELSLTLGTAPSPFVVRFVGPAVNPGITYYDANGTNQGNVTLAVTLAIGEWLEFNSQTFAMVKTDVNGVAAPGQPLLDPASELFQLEPLDSVGGANPTLVLSTGAAVLYVRKCWL